MVISEAECIEALHLAAERLGKSPTKREYERLDIRPTASSIKRIVGGWNSAKTRAGLETYKVSSGGGQPVRPKPDWVELPRGYDWEELTPQQRWYYKNREHRIAVKRKRLRNLRDWFSDQKAENFECSRCSEDHPACLVFHHEGEKELEISHMVSQGFSKDRILQEIDNCVPLCANCHHKEHIDEIPGGWDLRFNDRKFAENPDKIFELFPSKEELFKYDYRASLRTWLHYYKKTIGCERCSERDPACLEYHHINPDEKKMRISTYVLYNPSKPDILSEIELCEILCRNCHRIEHLSDPDSPK